MKEFNHDGNMLGRVSAVAILLFVAFSLRGMNGDGWMCPLMKTFSCCTSAAEKAAPAAAAPAVPAPAKP